MPLPDPVERPLLRVSEAIDLLGVIGRSAFYESLKHDEKLANCAVHVGRRTFLSTARLREWVGLDTHTNGASDGANGDGISAHDELAPRRE